MVDIDPRCSWVQLHPAPDGAAWRLVKFVFENDQESGGNHNIYINIQNADGSPATTKIDIGWPTFEHPDDWVGQTPDAQGNTDFPITNAIINDTHPRGPYWVMPEHKANHADMVDGMGLPANHHVNYRLFYQWQEAAAPPPPPPPDDDEPPFWTAVRAVSNQIPPAQFLLFPYAGQTFQLTRTGDGGVFAVGVEQKINMYMMLADEVLKP